MDTFNYKSTRNISPSISMGQRFISKCIAARVCFEETITSGGSAINRGCSLPDRCAVPLCQMRSTRNSMGGEEKSEGGSGGGLAENRYKMTIYVPCPVIYHPRARNFQLREEQIKTPSHPWLWLEASTCDLPASLSLFLFLRNWSGTILQGGRNVSPWLPYLGGKAIRGDIGGINRVYF